MKKNIVKKEDFDNFKNNNFDKIFNNNCPDFESSELLKKQKFIYIILPSIKQKKNND